ncbi:MULTISPECIES: hypothetical protein [unclassified Actinomyces]|uniref:hypothetical protein n=1 Tax=unclassified Actinomyces TaxID=2609248 RepID=UPI000D5A221F|nr:MULTISPECIES: hypothetical protein [unclassified Actinomyces]RAX19240.1 hypothetical protein DRB06_14110 [Actinomyces sp. Z5]RAX22579.1 hypothetical protein DRB07_07865 [Actinomyces sp. Z3]
MPTPRAAGWSLLLVGIALSALAACTHLAWLWIIAIVVLVASIGTLAVAFVSDADGPGDGRRR